MNEKFPEDHLPFPPMDEMDEIVKDTKINNNYHYSLLYFTSHSVISSQLLAVLPSIIKHIETSLKSTGTYLTTADLPEGITYQVQKDLSLIKEIFESEYRLGCLLLNQNLVTSKTGENIVKSLGTLIKLTRNGLEVNSQSDWKNEIIKARENLYQDMLTLEEVLKDLENHIETTKFNFCSNITREKFPDHLQEYINEHILDSKIWI